MCLWLGVAGGLEGGVLGRACVGWVSGWLWCWGGGQRGAGQVGGGGGGLVMGRYCIASGIVLGGLVMGWLWVGSAF